MRSGRTSVVSVEPLIALATASLAALAVVATAGVDVKYRLAGVLALAGLAFLIALPERRIACVLLWLLIHPLGVEKVFFIDAAEFPLFMNPSLVFNMSDGPLALLALFTAVETVFTGRIALRWSRVTTVLSLLLVWSLISYAIHAAWLTDGFVTSAPLALLQNVRLLVFVLLVQSAIRSRGDVILVLLTTAAAVFVQVIFVAVSSLTGRELGYATTTGGLGLQTFDTSGTGSLSRATGTVGQVNQQAAFHVFLTIPLIALLIIRNRLVRALALAVIVGSCVAIVLTFSRGAWLACPIGLAVCLIMAASRGMMGKASILVGAGSLVCCAVALMFLGQPIYQRLAYGDSGATASRLRMLGLAGDLFQEYPVIGVGPGEYVEAAMRLYPPGFDTAESIVPGERLPFPGPTIGRVDLAQVLLQGVHYRRPLPVHNKYMLMLAELGVPGLLLWLWLYVEFIRAAWRCSKSGDGLLALVGIGGIGTAVAQLLYMNVDLFVEDKPLEIMLFGAALMAAAARVASPGGDRGTAA